MLSSRMAGSALRELAPRLFSAAAISSSAGFAGAGAAREPAASSALLPAALHRARCVAAAPGAAAEKAGPAAAGGRKDEKAVVSYWGVAPPKLVKEDGSEWKWPCFTRRYEYRVMMLETVAAVPGMVAGVLLHLRSLRRFEHSGGWIRALLDEAENERMHLMTFMELTQPRWYERALVFAVQGVFFNAYFVTYLLSPKLAHRIVGYLEEEAIHSYNEFMRDLEAGKIENVPAPAIAIDYWRLPPNATLKDVVRVVRADEAHHRDVNHFASDIHYQGRELREMPAPIGYH